MADYDTLHGPILWVTFGKLHLGGNAALAEAEARNLNTILVESFFIFHNLLP